MKKQTRVKESGEVRGDEEANTGGRPANHFIMVYSCISDRRRRNIVNSSADQLQRSPTMFERYFPLDLLLIVRYVQVLA